MDDSSIQKFFLQNQRRRKYSTIKNQIYCGLFSGECQTVPVFQQAGRIIQCKRIKLKKKQRK